MKKIFSIWVYMDVQNYRADSIQEYRLTEKVLHGNFHDELKNYALITIIILNLGKNSTTHKLLNLLHLIFMELKTSEEKEKTLREEYDLEISEDMKEELEKMGGLMQPLLDIAAEQAAEKAATKATAETEIKTNLQKITETIIEESDITLQEILDKLHLSCTVLTLCKIIRHKLGFTRKKSLYAAERDKPEVQAQRAEWKELMQNSTPLNSYS